MLLCVHVLREKRKWKKSVWVLLVVQALLAQGQKGSSIKEAFAFFAVSPLSLFGQIHTAFCFVLRFFSFVFFSFPVNLTHAWARSFLFIMKQVGWHLNDGQNKKRATKPPSEPISSASSPAPTFFVVLSDSYKKKCSSLSHVYLH